MAFRVSSLLARMTLAAAGALLVALPVCVAYADSLEQSFASPSVAARPWVRWWWPGGAVQDAELRREVDLLANAGFGGAEIQPFNPGITDLTAEERAAINDYATPSFFAHVRAAAEQSALRGLQIDYTFGSAWPSGGGFEITPELALVELTMSRTTVDDGQKGPIKITLPPRSRKLGALSTLDPRVKDPRAAGWPARMDARQKLVAVVAVKGNDAVLKPERRSPDFKLFPWGAVVSKPGTLTPGSAVVLTDRLREDGTLDWKPPPGQWQVLAFKQYAVSSSVFGGVGAGPQLVLDHFKPEAFDAHARHVGEPLVAALGAARSALRATFIDSLELMPDLYWSEDFLEQFRLRRGYDLTPHLPLILQPGWMESWDDHYSPPYYEMDDIGARVRADYQQTVSDLLIERFFVPYVEWNRRNGVAARLQAHGAPVDMLKAYGLADIPETEDLYEFADPYFMRLARSAADLYGRRIVTAESFVWKDRPFAVTPAELRRRADLLFASGVNSLVLHGFPYALHRDVWPGWHAFAPSGFSVGFSTMIAETNPIWAAMPTLAEYIARTQSVLSAGHNVVPVAVYLDAIGYFRGIEDNGLGTHDLERALMSGGYDYDRINADSLAKARVERGRLVTAGGATFSALVLPKKAAIDVEAAERIAAFAGAGLPVLFVEAAPERHRGFFEYAARDRRVGASVAATLASHGRVVPLATVASALRESAVPANLKFLAESVDLLFVQREAEGRAIYFVHNAGAGARDASFETSAPGAVERWDAFNGTAEPQTASVESGITRVKLALQAGESALLVFDPSKAAPAHEPATRRALGELRLPTTGWTLRATGHGAKGRIVDTTMSSAQLGDWRSTSGLEDFSGAGLYSTTFKVEREWRKKGVGVALDLGQFHDVATVKVNERTFRPLFDGGVPDIGAALQAGVNRIEITVANTPNNALVDPKRPGYKTLTPQPAGLIGPVVLRADRAGSASPR